MVVFFFEKSTKGGEKFPRCFFCVLLSWYRTFGNIKTNATKLATTASSTRSVLSPNDILDSFGSVTAVVNEVVFKALSVGWLCKKGFHAVVAEEVHRSFLFLFLQELS